MFIDSDGKITKQVLWVFDCTGRAAELAAAFSVQTPTETSYNLTDYAEAIGVERFMRRFPPTSFYNTVQTIVCPAAPQ